MNVILQPTAPRWFRPNHRMKWHLLLIYPWFIPLISYLLLGERYLSDFRTFVLASAINLIIALLCMMTIDRMIKLIVGWYPELHQALKRVTLLFVMFSVTTPAFILGGMGLYAYFNWFGYQYDPTAIKYMLLFNVVANIVSVAACESIHSLTKWRETTLEKEQLHKATLQGQFESLKSQVNPHFLFNTLNSLSSLITDEPQKAELFVDEMANVYRYLLQTNDRELTPLSAEIAFIHSYFHLLKTRYGHGIKLDVDITNDCLDRRLPPLTLQMLVENAVKHNVILAARPLQIDIITTPDQQLMVRNNLQRKTTRVASNKIGLANITAKYRLLAQSEVIIQEDTDHFTIVLPLLTQ